jgi:hypothetical protein
MDGRMRPARTAGWKMVLAVLVHLAAVPVYAVLSDM